MWPSNTPNKNTIRKESLTPGKGQRIFGKILFLAEVYKFYEDTNFAATIYSNKNNHLMSPEFN